VQRGRGGRVNEGNEGGVDRWSVLHGAEVGGGSALRDGGARCGARRKKGGLVGWLGQLGRSTCWADSRRKGPWVYWAGKLIFHLEMNSKIEIKVWKLIWW
jgi:hypothetical protein